MLRDLRKKLEELHMIEPGDIILAGVSGGADSLCLLTLLMELQKQMNFTLEVLHVEHGIRGEESKEDAGFVEETCARYQVVCHKVEVDVPKFCELTGLGVEEAARKLRYQVFVEYALEKQAKIALAHHQEDNAETILFQMVRGSSLAGLCGMQPVRKDENGVCYIRPLLFFHREEIEDYLNSRNMRWCVDSTNAELEYSRNFLRNKVIPQLENVNLQAVEHINQTAAHLSEMKDYLDSETEKAWKHLVSGEEKLALDVKGLMELHPVLQRQIAYRAIVYMAKKQKDITSVHVMDVLDLCKGQSGKRISLPYGMTAWKTFQTVYLSQEEISSADRMQELVYEISPELLERLLQEGNDLEICLGEVASIRCRVFHREEESLEIPRKTYTKWFDYDKIKCGLCIRTRRSGDYFISDEEGHRKKLKSYFIDEKIPLEERAEKWLLAKNSEVIWLFGGRISEHVKISKETKYIFEVTYDGGKEHE